MTRKVLSVASECAPLVKTGGLADVAGALPAAMAGAGWQMRTLLPGYPAVMKALGKGKAVWEAGDLFGGPGRVLAGRAAGLDLLVVDAPHLYDRPGGIYLGGNGRDWPDNPERFAALSWAAAAIAVGELKGWQPELVHCHDWQAGFAPTYLRGSGIPTLLTVHNIAFHGLAPTGRMASLRLPADQFHSDGFEFWGQISALKAGLVHASAVSTVSPTYARELTTEAFGMGLDGVIRARQGDLSGILNGIDEDVWNPATDPNVIAYKTPAGKKRNKKRLQQTLGLPVEDRPLAVVVSRLSGQKGLDVLLDVAPGFTADGGQLALLGSGDPGLETGFRALSARDSHVGVHIGYDEPLSHLMYAGGDAVLVPSRFEPCGLTQMYGLRYGAVPVVARTGGLADTVIDANDAALRAGVATGIQFATVDGAGLAEALTRLLDLYRDAKTWARIQRNGMRHPVGWEMSAAAYGAVYDRITGRG